MASSMLENKMLLFAAGAGSAFAWVFAVFFHNLLFSEAAGTIVCSAFYIAGMAVSMISLSVMGSFAATVRKALGSTVCVICVAVLMAFGTVCSVFSDLETEYGPLILFTGMVTTGVGCAFFVAMWGCFFSYEVTRSLPAQCLSYAVAVVLFCLIAFVPHAVAVVATGVLPLFSAFVFLAGRRPLGPGAESASAKSSEASDGKPSVRTGETSETAFASETTLSLLTLSKSEVPFARIEFFARAAAAALLYGIVVGLMNFTVQGGLPENVNRHFATLFILCVGATLAVISTYVRISKRDPLSHDRFVQMYVTALFVLLAALLTANALQVHTTLLAVIGLTGYICLRIAFWCLFAAFARSGGISAVQIFCIGEGCLMIGLFAGSLLSGFLPLADGSTLTDSIAIGLLIVTYMFVLNDRKVFAVLSETTAEEAPDTARFDRACEELAASFGLSKRETEVFLLSARGHSAARIAEDLYVSTGTVQTHIKNIYRKCDIHSRQELLDLVEERVG